MAIDGFLLYRYEIIALITLLLVILIHGTVHFNLKVLLRDILNANYVYLKVTVYDGELETVELTK